MASYMSGVQSVMKTLRLPIATRPRPVFIGSQMQRILVAQQCERRRMYAIGKAKPVEPPEYLDEGERRVFDKIKETLQPTKLEVQDISGGCGSMYALNIVSDQFKGLSVIKQHRLVNKMLGDEIKEWHGVRMNTRAP